jgi:TetR/AcrR family transcriptional repressor of nem operon
MRRSREQKRQAHEQILRAAARAFRAGGVERVGIAALMGDAGLTHGGFYAHFASKDELVGEAASYGLAQSAREFFDAAAQAASDNPLREILRRYISRQHRDGPGEGCVIPTLGGEIAREPPDVRHAFSEGLEGYLTQLAEYAPGASAEARHDNALVLLSGMVGAVLLSRVLDDAALSDRALLVARHFFTDAFASSGASGRAEGARDGAHDVVDDIAEA